LVFLDLVILYHYKTNIEISALLSAILVNLLVWERLRDSLSKKLEYLHKNLLFKLYTDFQSGDMLYFSKDEVKRIRSDLERYGRFMGIPMYPRNLLKSTDKLLSLHGEFYRRTQIIHKLGLELIGEIKFRRDLFWKLIGLKQSYVPTYTPQNVQIHEEKVKVIKKEQTQLIEEIIDYEEKTRKMRKALFGKLEDFLKSNNLRLEPEPVYSPYRW